MADKPHSLTSYVPSLTRRQTLKWIGVLSATAAFPLLSSCDKKTNIKHAQAAHWPDLTFAPVTTPGYGKDPSLIVPPTSPWPLLLKEDELNVVAVLADIIVPRELMVPSATEVKVPEVINEWVSAPYSRQQEDRLSIMSLLSWLNTEALQRSKQVFIQLSAPEQMTIIDDIAFKSAHSSLEFGKPAVAFAAFRRLVLAAFFCSPQGSKDLGYQGNVPISGDYPGPTKDAKAHLDTLLTQLGLSL